MPMWVAEMDSAPCPPVVEAVTAALAIGDTGYHPGFGYAEALLGFAEKRWDWSFDPAATRTLPDVMIGVVEVLRVLTAPGDAVVVNSPVYPPFFGFVQNEGRRVAAPRRGPPARPARPRGGIRRRDRRARQRARPGQRPTGGLAAVQPAQPDRQRPTAEELGAAVALADRYGVRVVADEIHAPLTRPGRDGHPPTTYTPLLTVPGTDNAIAVLSASKGWNLAGLKAAIAVAGPAAADDLRRIPEEAGHGVSHLGAIAHIAAWRDGGDWLDATRAGVERNAHLLTDLLAEHLPAVRYRPGDATFFAWLDGRALPAPVAADPAGWFVEHARVAVNDGRPSAPVVPATSAQPRHQRGDPHRRRRAMGESVSRSG